MDRMNDIWDGLLLVSLGPVQDFIAAARRCQDLWYGSWLLSDLSRSVAGFLAAECGEEALVFPGSVKDRETAVANKIMCLLPRGRQAARVADDARKAMEARFARLRSEAFERIDSSKLWNRDAALQQIADLLEWNWVCVSIEDEDLASARRKAERFLAARKNTRAWKKVRWSLQGRRKDSIDGQRESVIDDAAYAGKRSQLHRFGVRTNERLGGVSLLKRRGQDVGTDDPAERSEEGASLGEQELEIHSQRPAFHSTSHVAAAPMFTRLARLGDKGDAAIRKYWDALEKTVGVGLRRFRIRPGVLRHAEAINPWNDNELVKWERTLRQQGEGTHGFDAYPLFEDRIPEVLAEATQNEDQELFAAEASVREALRCFLRDTDVKVPNAYYAIVVADGDRLGEAIDAITGLATVPGERLATTLVTYRALSAALDSFAVESEKLVARHGGSPVFSGGDDVFAFMPLHTLLSFARALRNEFAAAMQTVFSDVTENSSPIAVPTLSVGIAIVHHLEPLVNARRLGYEAERLAKRERNSLAIIAQKRSGARYAVSGTWTDDATSLDLRLARWIGRLYREELPDSAAFELGRAADFTAAMVEKEVATQGDSSKDASPSEVAEALATRAIARRRGSRGAIALDAAVIEELKARLRSREDPAQPLRELADEIKVARIMLDAWAQAWEQLPEHNKGDPQ